MNQRLLHTPQGVRDIYGKECRKKNVLKERLHRVLEQYGYHDIETPAIEFFDIFNQEKGTVSDTEMYKFFDRNNQTLVLRPDMTPPIARSVAKYYEKGTLPIRLSYGGNIYLNRTGYQGKLSEVTQMGAELVNDTSPAADAEIIAMIVDSFLTAGLKEFRIDIGEIEFYKGLIGDAGLEEEEEKKLRDLIENKNSFGLERFLRGLNLTEEKKMILGRIAGLYGGREILKEAQMLTTNEKALKAIRRLLEVYKILEIYGYEKYVSIDLGMLSQFDYYTGIIFRGYTYGTGDAIAKGGRYDGLLKQFGKEAPSVGFAITVDDLLTALNRQKIQIETRKGMLLLYEPEDEERAIRKATDLRKDGKQYTLIRRSGDHSMEEYEAYCRENGISGILYLDGKHTEPSGEAE